MDTGQGVGVSRSRSRGGAGSPTKRYGELNGNGPGPKVTWASASAGSARVQRGQQQTSYHQPGFFGRSMRRLSLGLPYFNHGGQENRYGEKEKLGRGRILRMPQSKAEWMEVPRRFLLLISRRRRQVVMLLVMILLVVLWFNPSKAHFYRD